MMEYPTSRPSVSRISKRARISKLSRKRSINWAGSILKPWQTGNTDTSSLSPCYEVETKPTDHVDNTDLIEIELGLERLQVSRNHSTRVQRFVDRTKPLVDAMQRYGTALDIAANMSPEFLSPLWASLKALLNV